MTVFSQLESICSPIPLSLQGEKANILLKIAFLAKQLNQSKTALTAFESIKQLGESFEQLKIPLESIDKYIIDLKKQLRVNSK